MKGKILMKPSFFKLLNLIAIITISTITFSQESESLLNSFSQEVEFAWDVNNVLLKKNIPTMIKTTLLCDKLPLAKVFSTLIFDYIHYVCTGTVGNVQQLIIGIKSVLKNGEYDETIHCILKKYDPRLAKILERVATELYPVEGMLELISELNALHYTQRIATNMGSERVKLLKIKHQSLFSYFNGGKTVIYQDGVPSVKKPSSEYFQQYQSEYNVDRKKIIIFVDNKLENVIAALKEGFIAIQFQGVKKLRNDLKLLGIPLL